MAITALPGPIPMPGLYAIGATAYATTTIDATAEKVAWIFQVPRTGTLEWFEFRIGTFTQCTNGLRLSFQDVSVTAGEPDGTLDQFCDITSGLAANTWQTPPHALTHDGTGGGTKRSVTAGQWLACVVQFVSFAASDSLLVSRTLSPATDSSMYAIDFVASWTTRPGPLVLALKYSDGTYSPVSTYPSGPWKTLNTQTFNSGSTPDERGIVFVLPMAMRVVGAWLRGDLDQVCDLVLYDSSDAVLASYTNDPDIRGTTTGQCLSYLFATSVTLTAGATYRLVLKPTTGSSVVLYDADVESSARLQAMATGVNWYGTSRTNAGAWTDTDTTVAFLGLIVDGVDTTVGSGGGGAFTFVG